MKIGRFRAILAVTFFLMCLVFSYLVRGSDGPISDMITAIAFGFLSLAVGWVVFGRRPDGT